MKKEKLPNKRFIGQSFLKLVREKRRELNMSQTILGEKSGVARKLINNIELQSQNTPLWLAIKLSKILDIDLNRVSCSKTDFFKLNRLKKERMKNDKG